MEDGMKGDAGGGSEKRYVMLCQTAAVLGNAAVMSAPSGSRCGGGVAGRHDRQPDTMSLHCPSNVTSAL